MIDLGLILPAVLPAVIDAVKVGAGKLAGVPPRTVEDEVKLMNARTARMKAVAELDKPADNISPWVANLRASSRYLAVLALVANGIGQAAFGVNQQTVALSVELAQSAFAFLFGDRVYLHLRKGPHD